MNSRVNSLLVLALALGAIAQGPPPPGDDDNLPPPPGDDDKLPPPPGGDDDHTPPPPNGDDDHGIDPSTSGDSSSSACSVQDNTNCAHDGSTNEHDFTALKYDSVSGQFSGWVITNLCAAYPYDTHPDDETNTDDFEPYHTSDCRNQSFPAPAYAASGAKGAPLRGRLGLTIDGVNIYGPFDAGFQKGFVCTDGYCDGGTDVPLCEESMAYLCGLYNDTINYDLLLDTCHGHAIPYHYHADMSCMYDSEDATKHSPLLGISLDGYGIYGLYEGGENGLPELDACGGHTHNVPVDEVHGVTNTSVYHYHTMDYAPYTLGCYGPVESVDACKALYPDTCYEDPTTVQTADGDVEVILDCPCWDAPETMGARDHFTLKSKHYNAAKGRIPLIDADSAKEAMDADRRIRL